MRILIVCLLMVSAAARTATDDSDRPTGKALFDQHCAACHGPGGTGGRGADLTRAELSHVDSDAALRRLIRQGIPGTEMPGSFQLTDEDIVQVAAYVRSLGRIAPQAIPGDATRGRALFQRYCVACHVADGEGGVTGPAIAGIGARRSAAWMRSKLIDPTKGIADSFRLVELTTTTGRAITGVRVNEDTWSIQLRDYDGGLHSFWKRDLARLNRHADKTPMPSYRHVLSDAELDDMVAFLANERGRRR